ncbi:MAG: hypothetical protein HRU28_10430 [Rhizobiales bacterium]|nr:hypothetical protein [Hyphomicrobiales bacterium]
MKFNSLKLITTLTLATTLTACGHIPASTMFKLATMDKEKINPVIGQYAFRLPNDVQVAEGLPVVHVSMTKGTMLPAVNRQFILQKITPPITSQHLRSQRKNGYHIVAYKFSNKDMKIANSLMSRINNMRKEKNKMKNGEGYADVKFSFCTTTNIKYKNTNLDQYIKLNPKEDYFTMLSGVNWHEQVNKDLKEKLPKDKQLPKCK